MKSLFSPEGAPGEAREPVARESRRGFLRGSAAVALALADTGRATRACGQVPGGDRAAPGSLAERLGNIAPVHPRLHFDTRGRGQLVANAGGSHARFAGLLFDWVDRHRGWTPPRQLLDSAGTEVVLEEAAAFVTNAALAFVLSGNEEHLRLAKQWALAMCDSPRGTFQNYGLGIYAAGLARAYDWLHDRWDAGEQSRLRDQLASLIEQVYLGSFPDHPRRQWWAGAHLHHDFWIPVGGFGEAALALLGENPAAASWAARAKELFDESLSWLGEDGAWHEGAADWCYTLAPILWFYGAWQTAVGESLHEVPWLQNTARYRLFHWLPDDTYVYLDDSFRSGRYNTSGSASSHLLRRLASLYDDGLAQWLASRDEAIDLATAPRGIYQAPYEESSIRRARREYPHADSQAVAWNMLWHDPRVTPKAPIDQPVAHHFENMGVAVLRTGWGPDDAVATLACGPLAGHRCAGRMRAGETRTPSNYSHAHVDYGSFSLFARGEYLIIPAGYARRSSRFQNTVCVNGADFVPDPALDPRIEAFAVDEQRGYSHVVADATAGFPPQLGVRRFRRHLLLWNRGHCLVFDDVRLESARTRTWNQFQWQVHGDPQVHRVVAQGAKLLWFSPSQEQPIMTLTIREPEAFAWEQAKLDPLDGEPVLEAHRLLRPEWYSTGMHVLATMSWAENLRELNFIRHRQFLAVGEGDGPYFGFALGNLTRTDAAALSDPALEGREMLLFGWNVDDPGESLLITN